MSEPWSKFYWADWRSDAGVRACSYGARGLWMDLLALMAASTPYGHLLINGNAPTNQEIAQATSGSVKDVKKHMAELAKWGVPGINGDGVWYSRRLVRDHQKRQIYAANGQQRGKNSSAISLANHPAKPPPKLKQIVEQSPCAGAHDTRVSEKLRGLEAEIEETPTPSASPPLEGIANGRNQRGSRLSLDWQPDDADRAAAAGLDLERTTADFRDYWHAKAGRDAVKVDWAATWRKWCRRAADDRGRSNGNGSKPASTLAAGRRVLARFTGGSAGDLGTSGERLPDDAETQPAAK